jgi:predicted DNA-binding WGR domain protein
VRLVRNWGRISTKRQELLEIHADEATWPTILLGMRLFYPNSSNAHKWSGDLV